MHFQRSVFLLTSTLLLALTVAGGCDQVTGLSDTDRTNRGTVEVLLTDDPFPYDLVEEANATIRRVEAISKTEGHVVLSEEARTFNLLELRNGLTATLAEGELPAGTYSQLRLIVGDTASVTLKNGETFNLQVPSGTETGIKVQVGDLEVEAGKEVELTLDFDVGESFVVKGNVNTPAGIQGFIFKPVIKFKGHAADADNNDAPELEGVVEAIGDSHLVVAGRRFEVNAGTELDGFSALSELEVGARVEVEFTEQDDGSYLALKIDLQGEDDDDPETQEVKGTVTEVGASYVAVDSTRYAVNEETTFEGVSGLNGLTVGSIVEIEYSERADGSFLAHAVELEDRDDE